MRGEGLLLAFELVEDRASLRPLAKELNAFNELVDIAYENGLIIYSRRTRGGYSGDHFLIAPPMISTPDHVAEIIEGLDLSLRQVLDRISQQRARAS